MVLWLNDFCDGCLHLSAFPAVSLHLSLLPSFSFTVCLKLQSFHSEVTHVRKMYFFLSFSTVFLLLNHTLPPFLRSHCILFPSSQGHVCSALMCSLCFSLRYSGDGIKHLFFPDNLILYSIAHVPWYIIDRL